MTNEEIKELCLSLMLADREIEVVSLLKNVGLWDDPTCWRHLGDNENNYSTIGNQQSRPEAALVEKLVNAIDARLVNACLVQGVDPESHDVPQTITDAVARFFESTGSNIRSSAGRISDWEDKKRTEEARLITLAMTGAKPPERASIIIADQGEGQSPGDFPDTFCSLNRSNKLRIPFVQGKYNMGGTGALQFCGDRNLQLIVSRRNPAIVTSQNDGNDWGFTIIRRDDPAEGRRSSVYSYLAPVNIHRSSGYGTVMMFKAQAMPIFPEISQGGHRNACARDSTYVSLIKLYEYFRGTNAIWSRGGLLRQIDLLLPEIALPIRIYECRNYEGDPETNIAGLRVRLEDDRAQNIEPGFPTSASISAAGNQMPVRIFAFKARKAVDYRLQQGVVFTVNGQAHGNLTADFFRRKKVGMSYIADSLLVFVDCTKVKQRSLEDLFMNSRDRLRRNELELQIESELEYLLSRHTGLEELRNRRRQEQISETVTDSKPLKDILTAIVRDNKVLTEILLKGKQIPNPFEPQRVRKKTEYIGKNHPTFFKFKDHSYGDKLYRNSPINQRPRIAFETDVENDYLTREQMPGEAFLDINHGAGFVACTDFILNFYNGIATLNVQLPDGVAAGATIDYKLTIEDEILIFPFENEFQIRCLPEESSRSERSSGSRKPPAGKKSGDDYDTPSGLAIPEPQRIQEAKWETQDPPFDKFTALRVKHVGAGVGVDSYDFKVNIDNIYLRSEQKRSKESAEVLESRFTVALVLIALGLLQDGHRTEERTEDEETEYELISDEDLDLEKRVESFTRAVAPLLLPMIDGLGAINSQELVSTGDVVGE